MFVDKLCRHVSLRKMHLLQEFPAPDPSDIKEATDYFGPDERFQILADLFRIPLEKAKRLGIEPPFYCDYGKNIEFKDEFYSNFNLTVSAIG